MTNHLSSLLGSECFGLPIAQQVQSGVDWVTVTVKSQDARRQLFRRFEAHKSQMLTEGLQATPWSFKGYAGVNVEGVRWGTRDDSDIVMVSGVDAALYWLDYSAIAEHCSRLDLACTALLEEPYPGLPEIYYKWHSEGHGQPDVTNLSFTLVKSTRQGQTCYVGSRASAQMGRIYDKGLEQSSEGTAGLLYRWEVEYKKPLAWAALTTLRDLAQGETVAQSITGHVHNWFSIRDCPPVFGPGEMSLEVETTARVTSAETQLWWLSTQVAPTVKKLIALGRYTDTMKALGLLEQCGVHYGDLRRGTFVR
jgi:hypothetical protein